MSVVGSSWPLQRPVGVEARLVWGGLVLPVAVRWSRGVDVGAACGQLALRETKPLSL